MKTYTRNPIFYALLPALLLLLMTAGCKKASDTTSTQQQGGDFWLKGSVIDATTHTGIAGAFVYFGSQSMFATDAHGNYTVNCKTMGCGAFDVRVTADGYGFGFASATIAGNGALVNTILLKPLSGGVSIGSTGGTLTLTDPESILQGGTTTLAIPSGALSANVMVTFTRFTGIDVPGYAPASTLNLCAVNIGPAGTTPGKSMELRFALPFTDAAVDNLPLLKYDFSTNTWVNTGTLAQVNHATNLATVQVAAFGTYSLAIAGSFAESAGNSGAATTQQLDPTQSSADFSYQAGNSYPGGTPASISLSFLKNIASQNTKINGTRVSFVNETTVTLNYIGAKPDSVLKSSGFYRWVPQVIYAPQQLQMTTDIHGVITPGIIQKQVYTSGCGYIFVHDQGGGGK